jgi:hypothetical protein
VPKWKIEAASTALAWPSRRLDEMIEIADAARGDDRHRDRIGDALGQAEIIADLVPSRSIEVTSSSPAPSETTSRAKATASSPVALRPPWVKISQRAGRDLLGVDGDDDALVAELFRRFLDEIRGWSRPPC